MKITTESSHAETVRRFTITEDHPVVPMAHALPPKKIRVIRGTITYRYQDGAWIVKDGYSATLVGVVLKKDGSDSMNEHRRYAVDHRDKPNTDLADKLTDGFQWLAPIINLLRPTGELAMATLNECKVNS